MPLLMKREREVFCKQGSHELGLAETEGTINLVF